MDAPRKLCTAAKLVGTGQFAIVRRQWRKNRRARILARNASAPFAYWHSGYRTVCHPDWPDSAGRFMDLESDEIEIAILRAWLEPGDAMADIGVNVGSYAFGAAAAVGEAGLVLAVDADPQIVERTKAAAAMLEVPQVIPIHAAVADRAGELGFFVNRNRAGTGTQSLRPAEELRAGVSEIRVPARTLREICGEYAAGTRVRAVKVDIEGAEILACSGAPESWFTDDGPLWLVEVNPATLSQFGASPADLLRFFRESAYDRWLLPQHPRSPAAAGARRVPSDGELPDALYFNLVAIPRGTRWNRKRQALARFFPAARGTG